MQKYAEQLVEPAYSLAGLKYKYCVWSSELARFCKIYHSLTVSKSLAVRVLANISSNDIRSVTGSNLFNINKEINMDRVRDHLHAVKRNLVKMKASVPVQD